MLKLNHLTGFGSGAGAAAAGGDVTSYVFDGTSHLQIPDHADWDLTGDFTWECFLYVPDVSGFPSDGYLFSHYQDATNYHRLALSDVGTLQYVVFETSATVAVSSSVGIISDRTWYHIALVRNNDNYFIFVDGVDDAASGTPDSSTPSALSGDYFIGSKQGTDKFVIGYMDEIRVSDTARYTTSFTPTTTQFTSDANTLLLIHSGEAYTGALTGETTQSCVTFDGTGDYLSIPDHADWDYGVNDFTIEMFIYLTDGTPTIDNYLYAQRADGDNRKSIRVTPSGAITFRVEEANVVTHVLDTSPNSGLFSDATWHHLAVVRSGNDYFIFVDGIDNLGSGSPDSDAFPTIAASLNIGQSGNNDQYWNGNMDEYRISDTARYTSNFTPTTTQFVSDANTLLLIHGDEGVGTAAFTDSGNTGHTVTPTGNAFSGNGGTFTDSGNTGHTVTENGNAQRETESEYKFADDGVGYYFDGTTDYLSAADHADWDFPNGGDFTIELFVRSPDINASATDYEFYAQYVDASNWTAFRQQSGTGNLLWLVKESASNVVVVKSGNNLISNNEWHHIAICRENDDYYTYIDGVDQTASGSPDATTPGTLAAGIEIMGRNAGSNYEGYIDEYRISDICRYTSGTTFNVPTEQFTSDSNTKLLIHCGETKSGTTGSGATFSDSGNTTHTVTENGNAIESTGNLYKF